MLQILFKHKLRNLQINWFRIFCRKPWQRNS
jgi:hypothetical protein